jgi:hypothetical protein
MCAKIILPQKVTLNQMLPQSRLHNLPVICNVEVLHMHSWLTVISAEEDLKKGDSELTGSNLFKLDEHK